MAAPINPYLVFTPVYATATPTMTNPPPNAMVRIGNRQFRPTRIHAPPRAQNTPTNQLHNASAPLSQGFPPQIPHQYAPQTQRPLLQPAVLVSVANPNHPITIVLDNATEVTGNYNFLFLPPTFARPEIVGNNTVTMVTAALKNLPATKDREIYIGVMGGIKVNGNYNFISAASDLSEAEKVAEMVRVSQAETRVSPVVPEARGDNEQGAAWPSAGPQQAARPAKPSQGSQQTAQPARRSSEPPPASEQDPLHRLFSRRYRQGDSFAQYGQPIPQPPLSPILAPSCVRQEPQTPDHLLPGPMGFSASENRQEKRQVTTNANDAVPARQGVKRALETNYLDEDLERVSETNKKRACIVTWGQEKGEIKGYKFF